MHVHIRMIFYTFLGTDHIFMSHSISEYDYTDNPVSVVADIVVAGMKFLLFQLRSNRCTDLLQILCG